MRTCKIARVPSPCANPIRMLLLLPTLMTISSDFRNSRRHSSVSPNKTNEKTPMLIPQRRSGEGPEKVRRLSGTPRRSGVGPELVRSWSGAPRRSGVGPEKVPRNVRIKNTATHKIPPKTDFPEWNPWLNQRAHSVTGNIVKQLRQKPEFQTLRNNSTRGTALFLL